MTTISIRLPDSLCRKAVEIAQKEGVSVDQLVSAALGEKLAALLTEDYLEQRAARGTREAFLEAMSKVPDVEPEESDRL